MGLEMLYKTPRRIQLGLERKTEALEINIRK